MQNLEQVRARNALAFASSATKTSGQQGGEVIKKIPPLILNHGFLATAAYGFDRNDRGGFRYEAHKLAFDAIAKHLCDPEIRILPEGCNNLEKMAEHLTGNETTSEDLKLATAEAMAWLNYARRFVTRNGPQEGDNR